MATVAQRSTYRVEFWDTEGRTALGEIPDTGNPRALLDPFRSSMSLQGRSGLVVLIDVETGKVVRARQVAPFRPLLRSRW